MSIVIQSLYLLALSTLFGSMIFFAGFTTPAAFSSLPNEIRSQFLASIFPRYYLLGNICLGVCLFSSLIESALVRGIPWVRILLISGMLGTTLYAGIYLRPKIHEIKEQIERVEPETELSSQLKLKFSQLHRISVILNIAVMAGAFLLILIAAGRLRL